MNFITPAAHNTIGFALVSSLMSVASAQTLKILEYKELGKNLYGDTICEFTMSNQAKVTKLCDKKPPLVESYTKTIPGSTEYRGPKYGYVPPGQMMQGLYFNPITKKMEQGISFGGGMGWSQGTYNSIQPQTQYCTSVTNFNQYTGAPYPSIVNCL